MAKKMALPKIGVNMTEAVIAKWLVGPGDTVKEGDPVMEAETDKSTQEIYATESGTVAALLAREGETVPCYSDIMVLTDEGEVYTAEKEPAAPAPAPEKKEEPKAVSGASADVKTSAVSKGPRVRISPLARKIAKENGVGIGELSGIYTGKRIVSKDVLEYVGRMSAGAQTAQDKVVPLTNIRKVIAERMTQSHRDIPTVPLVTTVNASSIIELRDIYREKGVKVSYDSIIAKVVAKALTLHPGMNVSFSESGMTELSHVSIGVAVDTDRGLIVPVVRDADKKSLTVIKDELAEMVSKAKEGRLPASSMGGASMTVTNLGMYGVEEFTPIINPPESCILAVGGFRDEIVLEGEDLIKIPTMKLTLVFDHRAVDGGPAARFLRTIAELIETPELLI